MTMYEIEHYLTAAGKHPVQDYLDSMRDLRAHIRILRRIDRIRQGNLGDYRGDRRPVRATHQCGCGTSCLLHPKSEQSWFCFCAQATKDRNRPT